MISGEPSFYANTMLFFFFQVFQGFLTQRSTSVIACKPRVYRKALDNSKTFCWTESTTYRIAFQLEFPEILASDKTKLTTITKLHHIDVNSSGNVYHQTHVTWVPRISTHDSRCLCWYSCEELVRVCYAIEVILETNQYPHFTLNSDWSTCDCAYFLNLLLICISC